MDIAALAAAEKTRLEGYLFGLNREKARLEKRIVVLAEGTLERATNELHLRGVLREIEKNTPPPEVAAQPPAPTPL